MLDPCRRLEHEGFQVTYLTPIAEGLIAPQQVREALRADTVLVSIMHANNEIGVLQDIEAIGAPSVASATVPLHVDAAQSAGKVAIDVARAAVRSAVVHRAQALWPQGHRRAVLRRRRGAPRCSR